MSNSVSKQPIPDATLVWRTGRIEAPLNAFVRMFRTDVERVDFFNTFTESPGGSRTTALPLHRK